MPSVTRATTLIVLSGALLGARSAQAQPDREGVRRAALDYIEGFYEGDSVKLTRSIRPEVYKYGFFIPRGATAYQGEQMKWAEFLSYARGVKQSGRTAPPTAPREVQLLDVADQTASVKVTAFWGMDYLLMGRFDGKWMITHVLWQTAPPSAKP